MVLWRRSQRISSAVYRCTSSRVNYIPLFSWPKRVAISPPWLGLTGWDFDGLFWLYPLGFVNVTITQITEGGWSQPVDPTGHFWNLSKWTSHPNQSFDWLGLFVHVFFHYFIHFISITCLIMGPRFRAASRGTKSWRCGGLVSRTAKSAALISRPMCVGMRELNLITLAWIYLLPMLSMALGRACFI